MIEKLKSSIMILFPSRILKAGPCLQSNSQINKPGCRFEGWEQAPVPDQLFKDSTRSEYDLISKAFWSWPQPQLNPDALLWLIALASLSMWRIVWGRVIKTFHLFIGPKQRDLCWRVWINLTAKRAWTNWLIKGKISQISLLVTAID